MTSKEYSSDNKKTPIYLESVSKKFKSLLVKYIKEEYIDNILNDPFTKEKLSENISKFIKTEYNSVDVPYFYILESLNLCVEVEMSQNQTTIEKNKKFAEKKFSEILEKGMDFVEPIKRFALSEKKFKEGLTSFISKHTEDYTFDGESIKIEFN